VHYFLGSSRFFFVVGMETDNTAALQLLDKLNVLASYICIEFFTFVLTFSNQIQQNQTRSPCRRYAFSKVEL